MTGKLPWCDCSIYLVLAWSRWITSLSFVPVVFLMGIKKSSVWYFLLQSYLLSFRALWTWNFPWKLYMKISCKTSNSLFLKGFTFCVISENSTTVLWSVISFCSVWLLLFLSFIFTLSFTPPFINLIIAILKLSEHLLAETYRAE